ncbi:MAG: 2,5-diamino-6-(ribosylamino)-4(3H)-pyrimidinone 5'-phosphate reductase [Methanosphaera sp. rholeuAM74]|nr:MAG: 2,5-diamino-6-(ribosylamino)-4(3H)-pyrimidinone 5'-phosphate reductase [Methanosphaera sp. rholeuAM74]
MKPHVLLNSAMTVDGKIATSNSSMQISGSDDLKRVHMLRKKFDAIMVGINTVIIDNPRLTVHKIKSESYDNPIRIIVDSRLRIPRDANVLDSSARTIILTTRMARVRDVELLRSMCDVIVCGEDVVNLSEALKILYDMGISSIMLEGGSTLNFSMFKDGLVDKVSVCIGSRILGGVESKTLVGGRGFSLDEVVELELDDFYRIDGDIVLEYNVKKKE